MCLAENFNIPISPEWLLNALIISTILAIATPPVPGGAITGYAILFMQLGIPVEALTIAVSLDVLIDFIITGTDVSALQAELIDLSSSTNMLNEKILHKPL